MISHVAVVPHPPLLVPELSPGSAGPLRAACRAAVSRLGDRWLAVGASDEDTFIEPESAGSFRGYGVDVSVRLSSDRVPVRSGAGGPPPELPLPALVAGWLREQAGAASVRVRLLAADTEPGECERVGKEIAESDETGLLILGDGSHRHGPRSPGSEDDRAPGFDEGVARALETADVAALLALDSRLADELGAGGRVPWQVLAGLGSGWRAELLYSAAPFGVGYHVAVWERA
ncbi:MAG TPA: class III extradiol dioxygenase subunit B-like domain-containing protein [Amycolatopsis sp.]|nr:class III extradiol dioxygenase subunit B-like domain-containing protein [Amycolatopsis sp.]